jgi:hypothetical protein
MIRPAVLATMAAAATTTGCALAEDWSSLKSGTSSAYQDHVLRDGPIAFFPLHDPAGSMLVQNLAGSQQPGSVEGDVSFDGRAATFSGGYIGLGPNFDGMMPFMIEAWVRVDEEPAKPFVLFSDATEGVPNVNGYQVLLDGNGMGSFQISMPTLLPLLPTGATCSAAFSYTVGESVYLVFVYAELEMNQYNLVVYRNGTFEGQGNCGLSGSGSNPTTSQMASLQLGDAVGAVDSTFGLTEFTGVVSEVAIYSSPLTPTKILDHYATGMSGP